MEKRLEEERGKTYVFGYRVCIHKVWQGRL